MNRLKIGMTFVAAMLGAAARPVVGAEIHSGSVAVTSKGQKLLFDFAADPANLMVNAGTKIVGLDTTWTFMPGANQTTELGLVASIAVPDLATGMDAQAGFNIKVQPGSGMQTATSTNSNSEGLTISETLAQAMSAAGGQKVGAEIFGLGDNYNNLDAFFAAGGTLSGILTLRTAEGLNTTTGTTTGAGNTVPEPASMAVWGAIAVAGLVRRRRKA